MNVELLIHYLKKVGLSFDHRASRIKSYCYFCTQKGLKYRLPLKCGTFISTEAGTVFVMHSVSSIQCECVYVLGGRVQGS